MKSDPVIGWGLDVEIDADGNLILPSDILLDDFDVDGPRVELELFAGPFHGRYALWNHYPSLFVAVFGDDVAVYVQSRLTREIPDAPEREYVHMPNLNCKFFGRKLKLVR